MFFFFNLIYVEKIQKYLKIFIINIPKKIIGFEYFYFQFTIFNIK